MRALIVVDLQNDFMPFGALPVAEGDAVVPAANALMRRFPYVVATQDWHPSGHGSFASAHGGGSPGETIELEGLPQVLWPDHCVQGTPGASFHSALDVACFGDVVRKGTDPAIDSYSGFFDNAHRKDTGLNALLRGRGVRDVVVCGLATDYCVRATALDALELGFGVSVVPDACRAVDLAPGDGQRALAEISARGGLVARSEEYR